MKGKESWDRYKNSITEKPGSRSRPGLSGPKGTYASILPMEYHTVSMPVTRSPPRSRSPLYPTFSNLRFLMQSLFWHCMSGCICHGYRTSGEVAVLISLINISLWLREKRVWWKSAETYNPMWQNMI